MPELPDTLQVAAVMRRINATPEFSRAPVMRHLLQYLVDETLAGRGDRLKAYSVAVDALGRNPDFDASIDSYPRVQVGRLRRMIESFYATNPDAVPRLRIPLGDYRIQFGGEPEPAEKPPVTPPRTLPRPSWRAMAAIAVAILIVAGLWWLLRPNSASLPAAPGLIPPPSMAVEQGESGAPVAHQQKLMEVARAVSAAVARTGLARIKTGGASVDARYGLVVDLNGAGTLASLRLIDRTDGQLLWSEDASLPTGDATLAQSLRGPLATLLRPNGFLVAQQRREYHDDFRPGYPCTLQFGRFFRTRDARLRPLVRTCVAKGIRIDPNDPRQLATASFLVLSTDPSDRPARTLHRALVLARRATAADPSSAPAAAAEARVALFGGNCVRGRTLADRAVSLDPLNSDVIATMGSLLASCDADRAEALLRDATSLDPDLPSFYGTALIAITLSKGDRAGAIAVAENMRPPGDGTEGHYWLGHALAAVARGDAVAARAAWERAVRLAGPGYVSVDQTLAEYYLSPNVRRLIAPALASVGIVDL